MNWLGDAVMTTPALLRLREALPATHLALLTPAKLADLWADHPAVDEVIPFTPREGLWKLASRLRSGHFGAALVLPNSPRSALECFLARIPVRVGFGRSLRSWALTHPVLPRADAVKMHKPSVAEIRQRLQSGMPNPALPPASAHHSLEYLALVQAFGAKADPLPPRLEISAAGREAALSKFGLSPGVRWLGLNPGAEYGPAKRWPAGRFAAVARAVSVSAGVRWVLFGGGSDRSITAEIQAALPGALDLAGRTSLGELMAVLSSVELLLTNDTGPMHVAAALGVPVVVPFGSTSPELTGPGLPGDPRHRWIRTGVPCAPCFLRECPIDFRCMLGLDAERVTAEVLGALGNGSARVHES